MRMVKGMSTSIVEERLNMRRITLSAIVSLHHSSLPRAECRT